MKKVWSCLLVTLLSAVIAGCAKNSENISVNDSSALISEEAVLDNNETITLNLEDFWEIETNEDNIVKFATGLEIILPDEYRGNIAFETESNNSSFNRLLVCEKGNADAGLGGILFCLEFIEYTENPIVIMDWDKVFGLYEQGDKEYALLLTLPGDRQYSEDNQALINAYMELSSIVDNVTINTNGMFNFVEKDISELERIVYESDLSTMSEVPAENDSYSADAQEIEGIVTEFCVAYFGGDLDSIKSFLADQYIWDMDVYENSADKVEVTAIKGLEDIGENNIDDVCVVSVEYKEDGLDTYVYLTVEFIKTDKGWKIEFYGKEG